MKLCRGVIVCFLGGLSLLWAEAPRVVSVEPDNGDRSVDPDTTEIRIEFDQAMSPEGFSVTGGGESFPEIVGKPQWKSSKVFSLPVKLRPGHVYRLGVNSPSYRNFKNEDGESAVPYPIEFRTARGGDVSEGSDAMADAASNAKSVEELRRAIDESYSYRDLRVKDWGAVFAKYNSELMNAANAEVFAESAASLLGEAKDVHIWLKISSDQGAGVIGSFRRQVDFNLDFDALKTAVPELTKHNSNFYSGKFPSGVVYAMIPSWATEAEPDLEPFFDLLEEMAGEGDLILDVRANSGGAEPLAQKVAGCFMSEPVIYAGHRYRDPDASDGFGAISHRELRPTEGRPQFRGRVAVLMGPGNMSSCEAFLLMMKQVPRCALIGSRSYGSSGNPKPHRLSNGVVVYLPSWRALDTEGQSFEGTGIVPEVMVDWNERGPGEDPVLEKALELLSGR